MPKRLPIWITIRWIYTHVLLFPLCTLILTRRPVKRGGGGCDGCIRTPPPPPTNLGSPLIVKKNYQNIPFGIKRNGFSVVLLFTLNMVLWVEDPPFIDSCGIFWTKLCDSRYILPNVLHFYLSCFLTNYLQNARNAVYDNQFYSKFPGGGYPTPPTFSRLRPSRFHAGGTHAHPSRHAKSWLRV